jgi:hypothetical protein
MHTLNSERSSGRSTRIMVVLKNTRFFWLVVACRHDPQNSWDTLPPLALPFLLLGSSTEWMLGSTPPAAMVTLQGATWIVSQLQRMVKHMQTLLLRLLQGTKYTMHGA